LGSLVLGAPLDAVRIDELGFAAGDTQHTTRHRFSGDFGAQGLARTRLALRLRTELGVRAHAPFSDSRQIARTHGSVVEASLLRARQFVDVLFGTLTGGTRTRFVGARERSALSALGHHQSLAVDTLPAQPLERLEGIAMPHPRSVAKPSALERRSITR
jgi:hypothetical protein